MVTGGVIAISVFALLTVALSWVQWRFPGARRIVNGVPVVVIRGGQFLDRSSGQQRLSKTDLQAAARQQGIRDLADVELAVLETDGRISFFTTSDVSASGSPETGPQE